MELAGGIHHIYAQGNNRLPVFVDDEDRAMYVRMLARAVRRQLWRCFAYCLMPNHVHLLVQTPEPNLGHGMRDLHSAYARRFNERHRSRGHLFDHRYGSTLVTDDTYLWTVLAYIANNPVKAGLCPRAGDWRWSSHRAHVTATHAPWLDRNGLFRHLAITDGVAYAKAVEARQDGPEPKGV